MKKGGILIVLIIIAVLVVGYFNFFYSATCDDGLCFQTHQVKCDKARYIKDADDVTWLYKILGKSGGKCEIMVGVLQIKQGSLDKKSLEDKTMNCYLDLGDASSPEQDLSKCHGLLKEELQTMIIQNLHKYIVDNLGEINEEFGVGNMSV